MAFLSDIQAFAKKVLETASTNTNNVVYDVCTMSVLNSPSPTNPGPYAKGLLVNQWYFSVGVADKSVTSVTSPNGADSMNRIKAGLALNPFLGKDAKVFLSNNTEEAYYAEKLGWAKGAGTNGWRWSGKAPYAMIAQAVSFVQGKYS